jgi:hypothetical protein
MTGATSRLAVEGYSTIEPLWAFTAETVEEQRRNMPSFWTHPFIDSSHRALENLIAIELCTKSSETLHGENPDSSNQSESIEVTQLMHIEISNN